MIGAGTPLGAAMPLVEAERTVEAQLCRCGQVLVELVSLLVHYRQHAYPSGLPMGVIVAYVAEEDIHMLSEKGGDGGRGPIKIDHPPLYPRRFRKLQTAYLIILEVAHDTGRNLAGLLLGFFNRVFERLPGAVRSDGDRGGIEGLADDGDDIFGLKGTFSQ